MSRRCAHERVSFTGAVTYRYPSMVIRGEDGTFEFDHRPAVTDPMRYFLTCQSCGWQLTGSRAVMLEHPYTRALMKSIEDEPS